jgi:hypothetical protein
MPLEAPGPVLPVTSAEIEDAKRKLRMTDAELGAALGGLSEQIVNQYRRGTKPVSLKFSRRFRAFVAENTEPMPVWTPGKVDASIPASHIPVEAIVGGQWCKCPECAALAAEGKFVKRQWYWFASRQRRYCCDAHGRAWRRRQQRVEVAQEARSA